MTITLFIYNTKKAIYKVENNTLKTFLEAVALAFEEMRTSYAGGGGGGGTPLYLLYGDVPLDRVWFSGHRAPYFPDYSLKQGQGFTESAAHPYSMT